MLKEHMRVHDNIREYLCAECGKGECVSRAPGGLVATGYSGAMDTLGHPSMFSQVSSLPMITKIVDLNLDIVCTHDSGWLLGIMSLLGKWGPKVPGTGNCLSQNHIMYHKLSLRFSIAYKKSWTFQVLLFETGSM